MPPSPPPLILASTSIYRRELLERLRLPFAVESPGVEEVALPGEAPSALAGRLARAKAEAVASRHPGAVVIGSDQVADLNGTALGKPGTAERARAQLSAASGQTVVFHTAVAISRPGGAPLEHVDETRVRFRILDAATVERYVAIDRPLDCAGGFRSEGLGIALFEAIENEDPTALVGLPLAWVARSLASLGLDPLG